MSDEKKPEKEKSPPSKSGSAPKAASPSMLAGVPPAHPSNSNAPASSSSAKTVSAPLPSAPASGGKLVSAPLPISPAASSGGKLVSEPPRALSTLKANSELVASYVPGQVIEKYQIVADNVSATVTISYSDKDLHIIYGLAVPQFAPGTVAYLDQVRADMLKNIKISTQEALDIRMASELKAKFMKTGQELVKKSIPGLSEDSVRFITARLIQEMLGLGNIEFLLKDDNLEEICINHAAEPIWVYHRMRGWMKTDIVLSKEADIWNYASSIARQVGRQISTRTPLLDAYLTTGDRVNATLSPISVMGNTITIRKFARKPWTITDFLAANTISEDAAALLWLAMQYELNILISGGTGAGKTSLLNVISVFITPNQRVVSIEQTREITLPGHLQWVPLVVREASTEDTGEISMLDLMVNSLRMRPDRIIVGEIRRAEEAQVLFEAMHTGHSVYATLHAETVSETVRRLVSPPIQLPPVMLESLHLIVAMYRDRRVGIRRVLEIGELLPTDRKGVESNIIYEWHASTDSMSEENPSARLLETIRRYTNMSDAGIRRSLDERKEVLRYLVKNKINSPDNVSRIVASYYYYPEKTLAYIRGQTPGVH